MILGQRVLFALLAGLLIGVAGQHYQLPVALTYTLGFLFGSTVPQLIFKDKT